MSNDGELQNRAVKSTNQTRGGDAHHERYVSVSWLAEFWDVDEQTVRRDIRKRALPAVKLPGGQFRVRWIDARRYGRPVE